MAKLERITIRGFRSIARLEDFEIRPLNILVGANGAGKSNFLDFFGLLRAMCGFSLPNLPVSGLANYAAVFGGSSSILFNGVGYNESLFARLECEDGVHELTLLPAAERGLVLAEPARETEKTGVTAVRAQDLERESAFRRAVSSWQMYHLHESGMASGLRKSADELDDIYLRPDGSNLASFLFFLHEQEPESFRDIVEAVRLVVPWLKDICFTRPFEGRVGLAWQQTGSDYLLRSWQISDGTLRFLALATVLLQPHPPSLLLFDEPELGQHPQGLAVLAEMLGSASYRTQIVLATQSAALLDFFEPEDVVLVRRRQGASLFTRPDPDEYKGWLNEYSLGELWRKNVLTAGPEAD